MRDAAQAARASPVHSVTDDARGPVGPSLADASGYDRAVSDTRDDRLDAVLAELLADDGGPARAAAFAAHPDLAEELREFLADHDRLKPPADRTPPTRFGNYELIREVARGGMGAVWEARQLSPPRRCAVKVLRAEVGDGADDRARFAAEAAAAARLCHPHIAQVYDAGEVPPEAGSPGPPRQFLAMEFVAGPNLADYCGGSPLPARAAARALADVADAVSHAHARGVLHRDLKPANVLLDPAADRAGADPCDPTRPEAAKTRSPSPR